EQHDAGEDAEDEHAHECADQREHPGGRAKQRRAKRPEPPEPVPAKLSEIKVDEPGFDDLATDSSARIARQSSAKRHHIAGHVGVRTELERPSDRDGVPIHFAIDMHRSADRDDVAADDFAFADRYAATEPDPILAITPPAYPPALFAVRSTPIARIVGRLNGSLRFRRGGPDVAEQPLAIRCIEIREA